MAQVKQVARRRHDAELKRQVVAECEAPGASVARIALEHGLNANLVHRWRRIAEGRERGTHAPPRAAQFVALPIAAPVEPLDMCAGTDTVLARIVNVFGEARAHHAYLFANRRATRLKVLVHDGIGIWLCARRLHQGSFTWASIEAGKTLTLTPEQLQALVVGLPWHRLGQAATIRIA